MSVATVCPACEENLAVPDSLRINSKYRCPHCRADLVVIAVHPMKLDWDDWDDDSDDDDDGEESTGSNWDN